MKYKVFIPEVHYAECEIEADTLEECLKIAASGDVEILKVDYSHSLDTENYKVYDEYFKMVY